VNLSKDQGKRLRIVYWLSPLILGVPGFVALAMSFQSGRLPDQVVLWCQAWWWTIAMAGVLLNMAIRYFIRSIR
jgi:hypothetical protein